MEWVDLNRASLKILYAACDHDIFQEVAETAMDRVERYVRAQLVMSGGMAQADIEHLNILEACEEGDADRASLLMRDHIIGVKVSLLQHFPAGC